ncbi:hypothetical protein K438DRAFT_1610471 [Mycena galopus ATCC 62051]|nr:hypothetical protein K438DRAFT_1610471 [Mycena galopus ATCC 62051]
MVKKAKAAPVLTLDTVIARLAAHGISHEPYPINLEPDIRDVTVRRDFMSLEYGGNSQDPNPKIAKEFWTKTGMKSFMYLNLNFNPLCPQIPGAPGVIFNATLPEDEDKKAEDEDEVKILFARLGPHMWQYQGQYEVRPAPELTIEEWKQQSSQVRRTWVQQLSTQGWGRLIRANIALARDLRRQPTQAEKSAARDNETNKFLTVTPGI